MAFSCFRLVVVLFVFFALLEGQVGSKAEGLVTNASNNDSDDLYQLFSAPSVKPVIKASLTTVNGLLLVGALLGNILVIHIVRSNVRMRTTTNILIVNMAVSDLLIALIFIPSQVIQLFIGNSWLGGTFGLITCKAVMSSRLVSVACSVLSLVAIAIDRYLAVVSPLKRRTTSDKTKYIIIAIWILSVSMCIPPMKSYKLIILESGASFCIVGRGSASLSKLYILVGFVVTFIVPFLIMSTLYCIIGRKLHMRKLPGNPLEVSQAHALKTSRHVTKMMVTVVITFAICMLPIQIYLLVRFFHPDSLTVENKFWGMSLTALINNANCFTNPCIYAIFNQKFRLGFKKVLLCCCLSQDTEQSHTSLDSKAVLAAQGSSEHQANNQAVKGKDKESNWFRKHIPEPVTLLSMNQIQKT